MAKPTPDTGQAEPAPSAMVSSYSSVPLFLWFPPDNDRTFLAGVLRKTYKAHTNTALSFIRQKLHPVAPPDGANGVRRPRTTTLFFRLAPATRTGTFLPWRGGSILRHWRTSSRCWST
jgi:hypothetical protein